MPGAYETVFDVGGIFALLHMIPLIIGLVLAALVAIGFILQTTMNGITRAARVSRSVINVVRASTAFGMAKTAARITTGILAGLVGLSFAPAPVLYAMNPPPHHDPLGLAIIGAFFVIGVGGLVLAVRLLVTATAKPAPEPLSLEQLKAEQERARILATMARPNTRWNRNA